MSSNNFYANDWLFNSSGSNYTACINYCANDYRCTNVAFDYIQGNCWAQSDRSRIGTVAGMATLASPSSVLNPAAYTSLVETNNVTATLNSIVTSPVYTVKSYCQQLMAWNQFNAILEVINNGNYTCQVVNATSITFLPSNATYQSTVYLPNNSTSLQLSAAITTPNLYVPFYNYNFGVSSTGSIYLGNLSSCIQRCTQSSMCTTFLLRGNSCSTAYAVPRYSWGSTFADVLYMPNTVLVQPAVYYSWVNVTIAGSYPNASTVCITTTPAPLTLFQTMYSRCAMDASCIAIMSTTNTTSNQAIKSCIVYDWGGLDIPLTGLTISKYYSNTTGMLAIAVSSTSIVNSATATVSTVSVSITSSDHSTLIIATICGVLGGLVLISSVSFIWIRRRASQRKQSVISAISNSPKITTENQLNTYIKGITELMARPASDYTSLESSHHLRSHLERLSFDPDPTERALV